MDLIEDCISLISSMTSSNMLVRFISWSFFSSLVILFEVLMLRANKTFVLLLSNYTLWMVAVCVFITFFRVGKEKRFSMPEKTSPAIWAMSKLTFQLIRRFVLWSVEFGQSEHHNLGASSLGPFRVWS